MKTPQLNFFKLSYLRICLYIFAMLLFSQVIVAQILDYQNRVDVVLDDGTHVILYGKAKSLNNEFTNEYYYLPVGLRLSMRPDNTPEFLFLKYTTEETTETGGVQGALIHFLMEWGLTPQQSVEAQAKLEQKITELAASPRGLYRGVRNPKIIGAVDVYTENESFRIISTTLTTTDNGRLVTSGKAPTLPGSKIAVAGRLDKTTAQLLAATFEKNRSITDISIELNFKYNVLFPGVNGRIIIDWSKFEQTFKSDSAKYTHSDRDTKTSDDDRYTYNEVSRFYSSLIETKAVIVEIDKTIVGDEVADKIVEQFMNVLIESISDKDMSSQPTQPTDKEKEENPDIKHGARYVYNRVKAETKFAKKREVYQLKYRLTVPKSISITGNMGSWYDGVRNNARCVSFVNLNDPFFQHRDINLILDLDAQDMFGTEVNYVTVNVRKKRTTGNSFEDHVTIDKDYLKNKGVKATVTYARGEDKNPDVYEYQSQWSLRGGNVFPVNGPWIKGEWEGVTLTPPVKPISIQLEGDIDELKKSNITRVTAQIHYMKFGKEVEENIQLSVAKGEPMIEQKIFIDKNTVGYVYRLIFNHKDEGKLAMEWKAQINDDYIYAIIPEQLADKESDLFKTAKEAGKDVINSAAETVIDKFKEILGGN